MIDIEHQTMIQIGAYGVVFVSAFAGAAFYKIALKQMRKREEKLAKQLA